MDLYYRYFNFMYFVYRGLMVNFCNDESKHSTLKIEIENIITVGVAGCTVLGTDTFPLDVLSKL